MKKEEIKLQDNLNDNIFSQPCIINGERIYKGLDTSNFQFEPLNVPADDGIKIVKKCPKCYKESETSWKFCPECGAKYE